MKSQFRALLTSTALLCGLTGAAMADTLFTPSTVEFPGEVSAIAANGGWGAPIYAGDKVVVEGEGLLPGQTVSLLRGTTVLNDAPITVDGEGIFSFELALDADAAAGLQPVVVVAENPASATIAELKVSPKLEAAGTDDWAIAGNHVNDGLYQVAFSPASNALFVSAAVGRPPIKAASLSKVDADTLEVLASVTPDAAPAREDGSDAGLFGLYGIGVDDVNGNVWTTNTRQNTISVYKQSDLSLVKQFAPGAVTHARDVVVDEANGRAYASATGTGNIEVFDTKTLEQLEPIVLESSKWDGDFSAMALDLDPKARKLVTVSMGSEEAAIVDLASGESKVFALPGAKAASGVAYDAKDNVIFVASQGTDNLLIVNADDGTVLHDVKVGASPLNVTFEPVSGLAFVAVRGAGTVVAVTPAGEIAANLPIGQLPNQLRADGRGNIFAVNQRFDAAAEGDQVWKISAKSQ